MLRIIWKPGDPIYTGYVDPECTFTPGQIKELSILGDQIVQNFDEKEKEENVTVNTGRK